MPYKTILWLIIEKSLLVGIFVLMFFSASRVLASEINGTISLDPSYAFGENLGWINFGCSNCNVHITDTNLSGHAWSRQYGWINLSPDGSGVTNNCGGQLGGKAWSKSLGWVDFSGAQIDATGKFTGVSGLSSTKAGRINFSCDNCNVSTDWLQCSLRESPAQVLINSITSKTISTISANITITNEGSVDTEYQYEWCVVSDISNPCGGDDNIFYSSGAKLIPAGQNWVTDKTATVPIAGDYYFKLVVHYGANYSVASQAFTAVAAGGSGSGGGGGGGGSGGGSSNPNNPVSVSNYDSADFNRDHKVDSTDFSILLFFWKKSPPFTNPYIDINKDGKVDSVEFSIMLSQFGKKTI